MLSLYWTFSCISVQQPSSSFTFVFGITIMFRSIDVLLSISLFACPTNTLSQLHVNMRERQTYNTFISQHFHFFGSSAFNCVLKARMGGRIPFTVFTKTCFSLLGSFSSSSTPWKMRPNVPVKDKCQDFIWGKGQERRSQRHRKLRPKCHLTHSPPCLADQWTEMDRLQLKCLCLLIG